MVQKMHEIIDQIIKTLFEPEQRRIQSWTDRLCKQNQEYHPQCQMFFWQGHFFRQSNIRGMIPKEKRKPLHSSLCDEADMLIKDRTIVEDDKAFVRQAIFRLLEPCQDTQDIRDALPECLVDIVRWQTSMVRTREAAFTIQNDPRALRDFEKMLPKIEVYTTARMIY